MSLGLLQRVRCRDGGDSLSPCPPLGVTWRGQEGQGPGRLPLPWPLPALSACTVNRVCWLQAEGEGQPQLLYKGRAQAVKCPGCNKTLLPGPRYLEWPGEPGVPEELVDSTAAMGLLTGDALWALSVAVAVFLLLVDLMHRRQRWAARYPPGPLPLPGLGNLLQIDFQNMPSSFQKMRFLFGDVFSLQLAWKPVIVLNGLAPVREALVNHSEYTSDRPWMSIYDHGVIMVAYGPAWCEQQHFSVSTMCNFGLGKRSLEQWVTEEASCLCTAFANEACR
ncbi:Hypothetical predicted protein [Marmota monax]|uniref:Uncharacterized protein n=1 Tax=Marmota monax TaxID=9995 RepID=A0A5E4BLG5_MARMO|nr:Hypothetical predicted protein [Marmota monax]